MIVIESDLKDARRNTIKYVGSPNELIEDLDRHLRSVYDGLTNEADRATLECRLAFTLLMIQKSPEFAEKGDPKEIRKQMLKVFIEQLAEMEEKE